MFVVEKSRTGRMLQSGQEVAKTQSAAAARAVNLVGQDPSF